MSASHLFELTLTVTNVQSEALACTDPPNVAGEAMSKPTVARRHRCGHCAVHRSSPGSR
jgi:hypothetical protein